MITQTFRRAAASALVTLSMAGPALASRTVAEPRDLGSQPASELDRDGMLRRCASAAVRGSAVQPGGLAYVQEFRDEAGERSVIITGIGTARDGMHQGAVVSIQPDATGPGTMTVLYLKSDPTTELQGPRDAFSKLEFNRSHLGDAPMSVRISGERAREADKKLVRERAYEVGLSIRSCMSAPVRENLPYPDPGFKAPTLRMPSP